MRAFKHISAQEEKELLEVFPTAWNFEWQDDASFVKKPFSLWSRWLHEFSDDPDDQLWNVTLEETRRRESLFCNLATAIINEHEVYGLFFRQNKLKKLKNKERLIADINYHRELCRPLFIPSLAAIFTESHVYTGWLYLKNEALGSPLISLVEQSGLKFIV